jgi:hypothetical protein
MNEFLSKNSFTGVQKHGFWTPILPPLGRLFVFDLLIRPVIVYLAS